MARLQRLSHRLTGPGGTVTLRRSEGVFAPCFLPPDFLPEVLCRLRRRFRI